MFFFLQYLMDDQNTHIFQNISVFRVSRKYSREGLIPQIKSKLTLDICYNSARSQLTKDQYQQLFLVEEYSTVDGNLGICIINKILKKNGTIMSLTVWPVNGEKNQR